MGILYAIIRIAGAVKNHLALFDKQHLFHGREIFGL
jgi:hypothetical protein